MTYNTEQINTLLNGEYARLAQILRSGDLFSPIINEMTNVSRSIRNLERIADYQKKQQQESIIRKYQAKIDQLQNMQQKLTANTSNPAMLSSNDISQLLSMLNDMQGLLDVQKEHEIQLSDDDVTYKNAASIEQFKKQSQDVMDKHIRYAQDRLLKIQETFVSFENFYETASADSPVWNNLRITSVFPAISHIKVGETQVDFDNVNNQHISYIVPDIVPFFGRSSLTIVYKQNERQKLKLLLDNIIVRCLMSAETGNILFHFMDGKGNGSLFFDYLKVQKQTLQLFDNKIYIIQEIERCLLQLDAKYRQMDQEILKGENIIQYNRMHPKAVEPMRIVVMDSFPNGLSSSYISVVARLMNEELNSGLHFIFLVEEQELDKIGSIVDNTTLYRIPQNLKLRNNTNEILRKTLAYIDGNYNKPKSMLFEEYYRNIEWWKGNAANYTRIPLGLSHANNYDLLFNEEGRDGGVASASAIIVGMPGSGKSSLLHTIIIGACVVYSPNELHFVLIDMKGTEFKQYVAERLPHGEFIALKAKPQFGLHILKIIEKKAEERLEYFRKKDVSDYNAFRNKYPDEVMPRYVIVIDEYQQLFQPETRAEAGKILQKIVRLYRALGFNLILSSQNSELTSDILDNISHRIAMRCAIGISRSVLGKYDEQTPNLNTGQAIIVCENRDVVQSYYLPKTTTDIDKSTGAKMTCASYLKQIGQKWNEVTNGQFEHHLVVFDSEEPALLTNNITYKKLTFSPERIKRELLFSPGERYMGDGNDFICQLSRSKNDNILVVGGKLPVSMRVANTTFVSMLPQFEKNNTQIDIISYQDKSDIELYEAINTSSKHVLQMFPNASFNEMQENVNTMFDSIISDIETRKQQAAGGVIPQPRLLVIYRANINPHFKIEQKEGVFMPQLVRSSLTEKLVRILEEGPQSGVFSILHFDDANSFFETFDPSDLEFFTHRILLQMSESDSATFQNSAFKKDAAHLVDSDASDAYKYNMALYMNAYDNSEHVIIKPYEFLKN